MHRTLAAAPRRAASLVVLAVSLAGCGGQPGGGPAGAEGEAAMPPPQVTVVTVTPRTVPVPYELNGRVEGSREVEVRARVSGILLERAYDEGRPVRRGELLFRIDPAPYAARVAAAEADLAQAEAGLSRAEREAKRLAPLLAERAASQKDYDNAMSDAEAARAAAMAARARLDQARLDLAYTRVEAPISGLSGRAEHSEGSLVEPGDEGLLTRIVRVEPIWVRFSLADREMLALRRATAEERVSAPAENELEVELVLADGTVHPERGRVNFSDPAIDRATGQVALRAELPNAGGRLLPGQFVRVRLLGIERPDAILLPQRAVQQGPQGKFVLVVGDDGTAQMKPVEVGEWFGADWIVESGVAPGDRVVVDGAVKVMPGSPVQVVEAGAAGGVTTGAASAGAATTANDAAPGR